MPFENLNLGISLTLPTNGTQNWGTTLKNTTWTKISSHNHSGGGNGVLLNGADALSNNSVTTVKLSKNYGWTRASTLTPSGTTQTVDLNNGNVQTVNLGSASGDVTLTLSNPGDSHPYFLYLIQGATPRNVTWPANVKWPQGQAAILSTTNGAKDIVCMLYDGTNFNVFQWEVGLA